MKVNENGTFEVQQVSTIIKQYDANDLPAYFVWDCGNHPWYIS